MSRLFKHFASCLAIPAFLLLAAGSEDKKKASSLPSNQARGSVVDTKVEPEIFIVKDEPDAGYNAHVSVKNVGIGAGSIDVRVVLRTNEGDFDRSREASFAADETRLMTFQFHEPTMNVKGASVQVYTSP